MKKVLSSIITIVLLISMCNGITNAAIEKTTLESVEKSEPMTLSEKSLIMGDVDQNGKIDAQDAVMILKYVAHNIELSESELKVANTDGKGNVDAQDAVMILKYVAHNITEFPGSIKEDIDLTKLEAAKTEAKKYKAEDYSAASYKILTDALAMPESTQKEVDAKAAAITAAIIGLKVDTVALQAAKTEARKYKKEDYSAASYKALTDALAMSEKTQKEVDAKVLAINTAIAKLTVDTTALQAAKIEAKKYKEEDYTAESYKILKDALAMSEKTQKEIDEKAVAITAAISGLKTPSMENLDTVALEAAKTEAKKYKAEDYSVASYKILTDALGMSEKTQEEVDAKTAAITAAIKGLKVDKTELTAAKTAAGNKVETDYSSASWKALTDALGMPEAKQSEINAKVTAINAAIAGLTQDKAALETAKTAAGNKVETDYSSASWKALTDALGMPEAKQSEINAKVTAINAAIAGLTQDRVALETAKTAAGNKVETDYSSASWKALTDALGMPEGKQSEIDDKVAAINAAIAGLTQDRVALETAKKEAAKYQEADYTAASYKALTDALAMAEGIQSEIDAKVTAITTAISNLKPLNIDSIVIGGDKEGIVGETITYAPISFLLNGKTINVTSDYFGDNGIFEIEHDQGISYQLLNSKKNPITEGLSTESVAFINIILNEVGTHNLSIKIKGQSNSVLNETYTVNIKTKPLIGLYDKLDETQEITEIKLYQSAQTGITEEYNSKHYTLIPIYLVEGATKNKIGASDILVKKPKDSTESIEEGKATIKFYIDSNPPIISPIDIKKFCIDGGSLRPANEEVKEEDGTITTEADKVDYIGIAISNINKISGGSLEVKYGDQTIIIPINVVTD